MIKRLFAIILILTLIGVSPVHHHAQAGGSWSAWVYNSETGELVLVFPDGVAAQSGYLPLPPGIASHPGTLVFSPNGRLAAACMYDTTGSASVQVFSLETQTYIAAYYFAGPIVDCAISRAAFSPDNAYVAFGVLNYYPGQTDTRPNWELLVMEVYSNAIVGSLSSVSPAIVNLGRNFNGMMPLVQSFWAGELAFSPVPWGTEGMPEYDSLVWTFSTNTVTMTGLFGKNGLHILSPGGQYNEYVWVEAQSDWPQAPPNTEGPGFPITNAVMFASSGSGSIYLIYHDGQFVLTQPTFINDGQMIAIHKLTSNGQNQQWIALDRLGQTTVLPSDIQTWQVWGTIDGYVFLNNLTGAQGGAEVRYHRFEVGSTPTSYLAWSAPGGSWQIAWVPPLTGATGLSGFLQISPPDTVVQPVLPGSGVVSGGALMAGGRATINTTEGDMLRVRSGPGTSYAVSFQLPAGFMVNLLEGPVSSEGYTWWRLDAPGRGTGWAIEGLVDNGVYLQTLIPTP